MKYNDIKNNAFKNLKKHYILYLFTCLLASIMGIEFLGSVYFLNYRFHININAGTDGILASIINSVVSGNIIYDISNILFKIFKSSKVVNIIALTGSFIIVFLIWMFIKNTYKVIYRRIFLEGRTYKKVPLSRFLYLKNYKKWFKVSLNLLIESIYYVLWSLTIVGAFIKRYSYFLVPYIIAENPNIRIKDAINLSSRMMNGKKMECFKYEVGFLFLKLFGYLSFGIINLIYTNPYRVAFFSEFYVLLRDKYIDNKMCDYLLLNDEYLYHKADKELLIKTYKEVIESEKGFPLTGFKGFMIRNFGINLYNSKERDIIDKNLSNKYLLLYYENSINGVVYPVRLSLINKTRKHNLEIINFVRSYSISSLIILFFSYSFIGWLWEMFLHIIFDGEIINRGFLHGPWLPIYGSGALLILILLRKFRLNPIKEFFYTISLCGFIEFFTGYFLEKIYNMRWWDYQGYFLNLKGLICAEGLLVFAIGGLLAVYLISPLIDNEIKKISKKIVNVIGIILVILFSVDIIYTISNPNSGKGITDYNVEDKL